MSPKTITYVGTSHQRDENSFQISKAIRESVETVDALEKEERAALVTALGLQNQEVTVVEDSDEQRRR